MGKSVVVGSRGLWSMLDEKKNFPTGFLTWNTKKEQR